MQSHKLKISSSYFSSIFSHSYDKSLIQHNSEYFLPEIQPGGKSHTNITFNKSKWSELRTAKPHSDRELARTHQDSHEDTSLFTPALFNYRTVSWHRSSCHCILTTRTTHYHLFPSSLIYQLMTDWFIYWQLALLMIWLTSEWLTELFTVWLPDNLLPQWMTVLLISGWQIYQQTDCRQLSNNQRRAVYTDKLKCEHVNLHILLTDRCLCVHVQPYHSAVPSHSSHSRSMERMIWEERGTVNKSPWQHANTEPCVHAYLYSTYCSLSSFVVLSKVVCFDARCF